MVKELKHRMKEAKTHFVKVMQNIHKWPATQNEALANIG